MTPHCVPTPRPPGPRGGNERGFALPFTIFLVALITVMLAASFTRTSIEYEIAGSSTVSINALSVAQAGMQAFFGDSFAARPAPTDSFRYNVQGGYAWVRPQIFQTPADTMMGFTYIIRSAGYVIDPNQGSVPQGTRVVAQIGVWQTGSARPIAAMTAANGTDIVPDEDDRDGVTSGTDLCAVAPPITGYRAAFIDDPASDTLTGTWVTGGPLDTPFNAATETGIDWAAIEAGVVMPDYVTTAGYHNDTTYATYFINGDWTITAEYAGTGWLIVTGDLTTQGAGTVSWDGLVTVGGRLDAGATTTMIRGMLVTGLDALLGPPPAMNTVGGDLLTVTYDFCRIGNALARYRGFVPVEAAWMDNWSTY